MKKSVLTLVALGAAVSVMGQGFVNYSIRVSGTVVGHVYGASGSETTQKSGNTSSETPAGVQTYAGALLQGTGFNAVLFAAAGTNQPEASLSLVAGSLTTFRTGATLGGTLSPVPPGSGLAVLGIPGGAHGTFQIRAWDNSTGATWDLATTRGASAPFDVLSLGDGVLTLPADFINFRSFNIYTTVIPEPSTFVLAGLGAAALVIFRRRK